MKSEEASLHCGISISCVLFIFFWVILSFPSGWQRCSEKNRWTTVVPVHPVIVGYLYHCFYWRDIGKVKIRGTREELWYVFGDKHPEGPLFSNRNLVWCLVFKIPDLSGWNPHVLSTNLIIWTYDHAFFFTFFMQTEIISGFKQEFLSLAGAGHDLCCSEAYADHALSENFRQLVTGTGA